MSSRANQCCWGSDRDGDARPALALPQADLLRPRGRPISSNPCEREATFLRSAPASIEAAAARVNEQDVTASRAGGEFSEIFDVLALPCKPNRMPVGGLIFWATASLS